jgi:hypothetical protein
MNTPGNNYSCGKPRFSRFFPGNGTGIKAEAAKTDRVDLIVLMCVREQSKAEKGLSGQEIIFLDSSKTYFANSYRLLASSSDGFPGCEQTACA